MNLFVKSYDQCNQAMSLLGELSETDIEFLLTPLFHSQNHSCISYIDLDPYNSSYLFELPQNLIINENIVFLLIEKCFTES